MHSRDEWILRKHGRNFTQKHGSESPSLFCAYSDRPGNKSLEVEVFRTQKRTTERTKKSRAAESRLTGEKKRHGRHNRQQQLSWPPQLLGPPCRRMLDYRQTRKKTILYEDN
jgi:hypothetical protein